MYVHNRRDYSTVLLTDLVKTELSSEDAHPDLPIFVCTRAVHISGEKGWQTTELEGKGVGLDARCAEHWKAGDDSDGQEVIIGVWLCLLV